MIRFKIPAAIGAVAAFAVSATPGLAQTVPLGANLERFAYPASLRWYDGSSQGQAVRMAYLDLAPTARENGTTVVLLHGKNFCAATWDETARGLAGAGYRVIAPDQVGFCKSSKPKGYQYSFNAMAELTRGLLDRAGAGKVILVGHSTGGILATRFALLHPERVARLVLVNPLGLNDTLAQGVPYTDLGALRAEEAKTDARRSRRISCATITTGNGARPMIAGWRCWRGNMPVPTAMSCAMRRRGCRT
ncbi:alpha/beta fold hydrolase [Sphingomonas sp. STIS6.2]|uniref:alpha/beta fold hydrolase n=1 Tax=Sphingomonas sp. STIS6.2 TaxID=1379700 RepID=UPI002D78BE6C|nr:alpha/beta hydrolase [Sphingomonas sp. STIS6.2]